MAKNIRLEDSKIEHYYCGWVKYGNNGSSYGYYGKTFEQAMSDAFKMAQYYLGLGYDVRIGECERFCQDCHGSGRVLKRAHIWVKCPMCKGKNSRVQVSCDFDVAIYSNVELRTI